jgi:hypothetical protein
MLKKTNLLESLGLAIVLSVGFGVIWMIAGLWCALGLTTKVNRDDSESITVYQDGPVIVRVNYFSQERSYLSLDRTKIEKPQSLTAFPMQFEGTRSLNNVKFPLEGSDRIACLSDGSDPPNYWYFVHDGKRAGKGYFVGFNSQSKNCLGYVGQKGLTQDMPPQGDWFPLDGRRLSGYDIPGLKPAQHAVYQPNPVLSPYEGTPRPVLISNDRLQQIDLQSGAATDLMKSPDMVSLYVSPLPQKYHEKYYADMGNGVFLRTADRVLIFDTVKKHDISFALPEDLREDAITFYYLDKNKAVIERRKSHPDSLPSNELTWIDAAGKILHRKEIQYFQVWRISMKK